MEQKKLPNATLILVFGILSILTCCCYGIVGLILGIIAIVMAKKATAIYLENPDVYTDFKNVKTGKTLAYVGIILSLIYIVFVVIIIAVFGFESLQDQELMQQKIQELLNK